MHYIALFVFWFVIGYVIGYFITGLILPSLTRRKPEPHRFGDRLRQDELDERAWLRREEMDARVLDLLQRQAAHNPPGFVERHIIPKATAIEIFPPATIDHVMHEAGATGQAAYWTRPSDDGVTIEIVPYADYVCPQQRGAEPCDCKACAITRVAL